MGRGTTNEGLFSRDEWAALRGAGVPEAAETLAVVGC